MRFLSNSHCALSIFVISKIPTHCWKKASVTWPFSASGLLSMKIVFYLPVNTDKPKLIAVLVFFFFWTTALFIAQISSFENVMKIVFYLPANTDKPKLIAVLVFFFFWTTASFIAQISAFENVLKRDAILAPVAKQWIAKDIPSYRSQSKRAKIAIHWFGKY